MVRGLSSGVSIVIPCYNEAEGIPQLAEKLLPVADTLGKQYQVQLVFVDDGSKDNTYELLHQHFGQASKHNVLILKHDHNRNLGAALRTGFAGATGDYVVAFDSDCTYHPEVIVGMLQQMNQSQADVVTVSPLHPQGKVLGVPEYRIFLSRSVSNIYRMLLGSGLYTHTAMVRAYKKPVLESIPFQYDNFLAVTEIMVKALLRGYKVQEYPCSIELRKYGSSKMKIARVIASHLNFIRKIMMHKTFQTSF